jgi:hypothetical protein
VAAEVDADRTEAITQSFRQRVEEPGTEPVGVQQQERRPVAAPVERGDT